MRLFQEAVKYTPVQSDEKVESGVGQLEDGDLDPPATNPPPWLYWTSLSILTLITILIYLNDTPNDRLLPTYMLKRPSPFIGFDNVDYNDTYFIEADEPTFPYLLAPVDKDHPDYIYPVDPRRKLHPQYGTLTMYDRQMIVSRTVSSVAQFRIRDYGMENCRFRLSLPPKFDFVSNNLTHSIPHFHIPSNITALSLDIWVLDTSIPLSAKSLSYHTRPRRKEKFASVRVGKGMVSETAEFRCPSDSLHTFEFACPESVSEEKCQISVLQDRVEMDLGVVLMQRASLT